MIARLRNNEPLVVEKKFGKGRVVAQLTKLSSGDTPLGRWTNWSLNPAFPVLANELVSYLAVAHDSDPLLQIGDDLVVSAAEGKYEPHVRFLLPGKPASSKSTAGELNTDEVASSTGASRPEVTVEATAANNQLTAKLENVEDSGSLRSPASTAERRAWSVATSRSTCRPAKATWRSRLRLTSPGNSPASTINCTTPPTWRSTHSNWPGSKWATRCSARSC